MISLDNVSKKFSGITAVNGISFKAKPGDIIGFLGPNGAGKTTTMRLLLGYLFPTDGVISVNGTNPASDRVSLLKRVGYLPENNPLYADMTVREYLLFISNIKEAKNFKEIIENVGLANVVGKKIETLSRGYKQRVGLAASLLGDPIILVLDEPTSGLDPLEQEKIRELIKKISKNTTIIFSTHILSEVEDIANRLIIINEGRIIYDGIKPKGKGSVEKLFRKLIK